MNTQVGFVHAFKDFWFRAGDFRGSSTRGQYWWIFLMNTLVAVIGVGILLVSGVAATFLAWGQNDNQPLEYVLAVFWELSSSSSSNGSYSKGCRVGRCSFAGIGMPVSVHGCC